VPPTPDGSIGMLLGTLAQKLMKAGDLSSGPGALHVERVAINAVMAGLPNLTLYCPCTGRCEASLVARGSACTAFSVPTSFAGPLVLCPTVRSRKNGIGHEFRVNCLRARATAQRQYWPGLQLIVRNGSAAPPRPKNRPGGPWAHRANTASVLRGLKTKRMGFTGTIERCFHSRPVQVVTPVAARRRAGRLSIRNRVHPNLFLAVSHSSLRAAGSLTRLGECMRTPSSVVIARAYVGLFYRRGWSKGASA